MTTVKKVGLWGYIKAAFNARPIGMFVPPNWIGIVAIALVGLLNPGFWAIGAGLELAYLYVVSTNKRFQRFIDAKHSLGEQQEMVVARVLIAHPRFVVLHRIDTALGPDAVARVRGCLTRAGISIIDLDTGGASRAAYHAVLEIRADGSWSLASTALRAAAP